MNFRAPSWLVWFAVAGGAVAFAIQFVTGIAFGWAQCEQGGAERWHLPVHAWQAGVAAGAFVVALGSLATSVWLFRRTYKVGDVFGEERRGDGAPPPVGRIQFLAQVGLVVNLLILVLIALDGIGAPLHQLCQQA
jgi:amino acid transporter